jgi:calcineurin-like phosphoesterase
MFQSDSQEDADVLRGQHGLVENDGAAGDFETAVNAAQDILARADEYVLIDFHARAVDQKIAMHFDLAAIVSFYTNV